MTYPTIVAARLAGDRREAAHMGLTVAADVALRLRSARQAGLCIAALDSLEAGKYSLAYTTTVYAQDDNAGDVARILSGVLKDLAAI